MSLNGGKQQSRTRTLALTSVVLVVAGIVLMLLGPATHFGTAVLGTVVLGLGVVLGITAVIWNAVRR